MAARKFAGAIGFATVTETEPGRFTEALVERPYRGDIERDNRRYRDGVEQISKLSLSVKISVISDDFARAHIDAVRYVLYLGVKWSVTFIEVDSPRLKLTLGDKYNG